MTATPEAILLNFFLAIHPSNPFLARAFLVRAAGL
jgi:hypothetical protein